MHLETNIGVKSLKETVTSEDRGGVHIKWSMLKGA